MTPGCPRAPWGPGGPGRPSSPEAPCQRHRGGVNTSAGGHELGAVSVFILQHYAGPCAVLHKGRNITRAVINENNVVGLGWLYGN